METYMQIKFPCKLLSCTKVPPWITTVLTLWNCDITSDVHIFSGKNYITISVSPLTMQEIK